MQHRLQARRGLFRPHTDAVRRGSESGNAIYAKVLNDYRVGKEVLLTRKVLREFDPTPGGLILPGGKVVKRFESERLRRVAWKMVWGLHFHQTDASLARSGFGAMVSPPGAR